MGIGITPGFTQADIRARMDKFIETIEKRQIQRLKFLGEQCVIRARSIPKEVGFEDQTGNLRGSIGYTVFVNGVAQREGFEGSSEGQVKGKELARKRGAEYRNGICLVVVAGMEYAVFVESRGKDVLTSTELFAKQEMPKIVAKLKRNINKALE